MAAFLGRDACGVVATARIMDYMAGQSAAQCGPCVFGLRAIADTTLRIPHGRGIDEEGTRLAAWAGQLTGRGACRHPEGAVELLPSALRTFAQACPLLALRLAVAARPSERALVPGRR